MSAVAIGSNGAGDALVLMDEGERLGNAVFVWFHETGELARVANDFSDLSAS